MIRGIIFDCDGILLDSEPVFRKALVEQISQYGLTAQDMPSDEEMGTTATSACVALLKRYPEKITRSLADFVAESFRYYDFYLMRNDLKPMKGVVEFVRHQHECGLKMGVASSSPVYYVEHKLHLFGIADCFDFILSGEDLTESKPNPEIYQLAAQRIGLPKEEVIVIEDSPSGIAASKAAGLYTVGFKGSDFVQDTSQADEEVWEFNAIRILKEK